MRILLCHNYYQQRGGEDESFDAEARLLRSHGHEVVIFTRHNRDTSQMGKLSLATAAIWNRQSKREMRRLIADHKPELLHCTNTFPLISPSIYHVAKSAGIPIVQSLRNFRPLCLNGYLFRDGKPCEDCVGRIASWPGIMHRCYRDSRLQSAGMVATQLALQFMRVWSQAVDLFITPSEHARSRFVAGGFPAERIVVKPNFMDDDHVPGSGAGGYMVFAGRLSNEKGIPTLLEAWKLIQEPYELRIIGEGPLEDAVQEACARDPRICWLGRLPQDEVVRQMADAACVVVPSRWYETFGRTIMEAFAVGTPAIVSRLGAMAELVAEGRTGFLFEPGNAADLASKIANICRHPSELLRMRASAREAFELRYTASANYKMLSSIYARVLGRQNLESTREEGPAPSSEALATLRP